MRFWILASVSLFLIAPIGSPAGAQNECLPRVSPEGRRIEALFRPIQQDPQDAESADDSKVLVVSYNVRYASAKDGLDSWIDGNRRAKVIQVLSDLAGDIVGVQEAELTQVRDLLRAFDRYAVVGVARSDGRLKGEASPIFYDRERFTVAESGVFWFGDEPMHPGTVSADAAFPRICTWARFIDLHCGRGLYVYNTHYDHIGDKARQIASRQIRRHISEHAVRPRLSDPFLVMGDLNVSESSEPYRLLIGDGADDGVPPLIDAYRSRYPDEKVTTFSGFKLAALLPGRKIDHILLSPELTIVRVGIDQRKINGRYPSDHFPIWAELR